MNNIPLLFQQMEEMMKGETIFDTHISDLSINLKDHTIRVVRMCNTFAVALNLDDQQKKMLLNAAWLHDVAKFDNKDDHHKKEYVKVAVESTGEILPKNTEKIYGIIENHKGKFVPDSSYEIEAAILRICDKLDRFNKQKSDAYSKCEDSLNDITKRIKNLPESFLATYEELLNKLSANESADCE